MKRILTTTAALLLAGTAFAQTTQTGVLGPSEDSEYALRVEGANGVIYNCKDAVVNIDGADSRECVREGAGGGSIFEGGDGLAAGAAAGGAAIVVLLVAGKSDNSSTTTTTSN